MRSHTGNGKENRRGNIREIVDLVPAPEQIADEVLTMALEYCSARIADDEDTLLLLRSNNVQAHDYLRHGLALQLAEYIASADPTVKAVYVCKWGEQEEEIGVAPVGATSPLSLIVWVSRKTAALQSLLDDLDETVTAKYREIVSSGVERLSSLLDVHIVDDKDVIDGLGCAALIVGVRERPTRVWERASA